MQSLSTETGTQRGRRGGRGRMLYSGGSGDFQSKRFWVQIPPHVSCLPVGIHEQGALARIIIIIITTKPQQVALDESVCEMTHP